jgi:hypothetical protein
VYLGKRRFNEIRFGNASFLQNKHFQGL